MSFSCKSIILTAVLSASVVSFSQLTIKSDEVQVRFKVYSDDVEGKIGNFEATINFDPENLAAADISGTVDVITINTGDRTRDKHLLSDEYFNVEKYPKISFKSTDVTKAEEGYTLTGLLKIMDTEKEITITFSYADKVFMAKSYIYGEDFGIAHGWKSHKESKIKVFWKIPVE